MLSHYNKEAIKVGLSVSLALSIALWFGWDKPYWAVICVFIIAASESYNHALRKGQNRLIGTLIGCAFAILLISHLSQDHLLFLISYAGFLAFCVYFSSHKRYGYAFTIAAVVCAIIASIGGFESAKIFDITVLRIQETILGMLVYSAVFRIVWPQKTEDIFFDLLSTTFAQLRQNHALILDYGTSAELTSVRSDLGKLSMTMDLPLNDSFRLRHEKRNWRLVIIAMQQLDYLQSLFIEDKLEDLSLLTTGQLRILESIESIKSKPQALSDWLMIDCLHYPLPKQSQSSFSISNAKRLKNVAKALGILLTCFAIWIYLPLPGDFIFPMIASIFASVLVTLPDNALKHAAVGCLLWGTLFLAQYVFVLPIFTELWQLAGLYFLNAIIIWKVCEAPSMGIQKVLAGNLSVVLCMSALQITPSYNIEMPISMLMLVFVCLSVASFYTKLFQDRKAF
ncbi:FUSC family protein [Alginatibacterium sediminis]|uniref:FUSC family protein n=1 Tax=Alginatibacterium sediminis TaxID=2164068 RepID=A0A420EB38_9ALTE|nr:FUSC family protein [Alginatibacterium sediminis]RKF17896.1 FUSC family protein [Alginatibacterium sediminis]